VDCGCGVEGVGLDLEMKGWVDGGVLEGLDCGLGRVKEAWVGGGTGVVREGGGGVNESSDSHLSGPENHQNEEEHNQNWGLNLNCTPIWYH
jgi:hypothetical protein